MNAVFAVLILSQPLNCHLSGASSLSLPPKGLVTWHCCERAHHRRGHYVTMWGDESSSVHEQITVSAHKTLTQEEQKNHSLTTAWWLSFTDLVFSELIQVLKAHLLHLSEAFFVLLCFHLLFFRIIKIAPAQVRKVRGTCNSVNVSGSPERAFSFCPSKMLNIWNAVAAKKNALNIQKEILYT